MEQRVFQTKVYYQFQEEGDDYSLSEHGPKFWIVAPDDQAARSRTLELLQVWVEENRVAGKITSIDYCEIEFVGTIDGYAAFPEEQAERENDR